MTRDDSKSLAAIFDPNSGQKSGSMSKSRVIPAEKVGKDKAYSSSDDEGSEDGGAIHVSI